MYAGDPEKTFLMVSVKDKNQNSLRFLWFCNISSYDSKVKIVRFARVAFRGFSRPLLPNATIKHHMKKYQDFDPMFVNKFLYPIYIHDNTLEGINVASGFELYSKAGWYRKYNTGIAIHHNTAVYRYTVSHVPRPLPSCTLTQSSAHHCTLVLAVKTEAKQHTMQNPK